MEVKSFRLFLYGNVWLETRKKKKKHLVHRNIVTICILVTYHMYLTKPLSDLRVC